LSFADRKGEWLRIHVGSVLARRLTSIRLATMPVITDSNGRVLFHLRNKLLTIRKTYVAESEDGTEIFRVKNKFGCE
jgi:uncharacterized protein YxjI